MKELKDIGLIYPMMTFEQFYEMMHAHGEHFDNNQVFIVSSDEHDNYWDQQYRMYVLAFEEGLV